MIRASHRTVLVLAGFVTTLSLLSGCGGEEPPRELVAATAAGEPFPVTLATASAEMGPPRSAASGALRAIRQATPGTKLMGRVEQVPLKIGERVRKGQLLARIESDDLQAGINQAAAAQTMAEAELRNATENHERMKALHARGSVTDKNLEDAQARFRVAQAQVESARAGLEQAQVLLSYAVIRSPLDGWLIEKYLNVGDMVTPGTVAFRVADLSTLEVTFEIGESQLAGLTVGQPIEVQVAGTVLGSKVQRIVPAGNEASRTFTVKGELDNPTGTLRSGMFARVTWRPSSAADASDASIREGGVSSESSLRVEASAIRTRGQLEGLFVADTATQSVRLRWIKTGARQGDLVTVLTGLTSGEQYVIDPPPALFDGAPYVVSATDGGER